MSPINVSHPLVFIGLIDCAGQVFAYMPAVSLRSNSPPQPPVHESLYEIGVSRAASHIDDRADKVGFIILVYRRDRTEPPCLPEKARAAKEMSRAGKCYFCASTGGLDGGDRPGDSRADDKDPRPGKRSYSSVAHWGWGDGDVTANGRGVYVERSTRKDHHEDQSVRTSSR